MSHDGESDPFDWAREQAALARAGRGDRTDVGRLPEHGDSAGRSEDRELVNLLAALQLNLLKWRFQPGFRSSSGSSSIRERRIRLRSYLRDNPSLKARLGDAFGEAYELAVILAARDTELPESAFPNAAPYRVEQAVDDAFWP